MPERYFHICWPDGEKEICYSPSSVIEQYLEAQKVYELNTFVLLADKALNKASDRVRQRYGYACSSAMDQLQKIHQKAAKFDTNQSPKVVVDHIT